MTQSLDDDAQRERIEHLLELGRYQEAVVLAGRLSASAPDDAVARYDLARALLANEDADEALVQCRACISNAPEWAMGYCLMSHVGHALKNFDLELKAAQAAVHLEPNDAWFLERLARAQMQSGLLRKARKTAEQMLHSDGDPLSAHALVGDICLQLGDAKSAEQRFLDALRLQADDLGLLTDLGRAQLEQKKFREAIDSFRSAVRLRPNDPVLADNLRLAVGSFVVAAGGSRAREAALDSLPADVRGFYKDALARRTGLQKLGFGRLMALLFAALLVLALVMGQFR